MRQEALSPRKDDSKDFISNETTTPQDTHHSTKVSTFIDKAFTILKVCYEEESPSLYHDGFTRSQHIQIMWDGKTKEMNLLSNR